MTAIHAPTRRGHGRVEAAKLLGMGDIPTVRVDHLTPAQVRAYVIADNRLAELAGWDRNLLALANRVPMGVFRANQPSTSFPPAT